jgi:uncharacterized protein YndB with AHSA1/START domain/uncharacterized damage-inducible protein DinB
MSKKRQVKKSIVVDTTAELAFEAVTKASELREWFSDEAWTEVRPGGRFEVRWNQGYRAEGTFTELDPPHHAATTWQGSGESGQTAVEFIVKPAAGGVEVAVVHSGFGHGEEWDQAYTASERGWAIGLENLQSTLETGVDLRTARQPFLGINLDLLDPERAANEGIAAERGIYILDTVEDSGARAAGLGKGDVIVSLEGMATPGFNELGIALRAHQAGDVVEVDLVRGQEREMVRVKLGQRPQVQVPETAGALADLLAERHAEVNAELKAVLEGVTDEEAGQQPAEGEWSVKQVLAHLSDGERAFQTFVVNMAVNGWLDAGPVYPHQIPGRLEAVLAVTPTLQGMLDRFLTDEAETVALVRYLPQETVLHKARFRRIAQQLIYGPDHTREHIGQIKRAIEAVRGS